MQNTELGVTVILCSDVNIPTSQSTVHISKKHECFGVWPEHGHFNFFIGGLLCVKK
jgi:hypothetical protein